jgi:Protein of unknown function (DUF2478)
LQEGEASAARIAAIQGAPNPVIQDAMWRFARRWSDRGVIIAGLIEAVDPAPAPSRRATSLKNLCTGETYRLFQDLGPLASACHLDGSGIMAACVTICREIERGCDLVVLNKFGQLEALRTGLTDAFAMAVEHDIPILTAVSPTYNAAWEAFSSPLGITLPAVDAALDNWWQAIGEGARRRPAIPRDSTTLGKNARLLYSIGHNDSARSASGGGPNDDCDS